MKEKYIYLMSISYAEAALQRYSYENVPQKIPPNLQENTHAKVRHHKSRHAADSSHTPMWVPPTPSPPLSKQHFFKLKLLSETFVVYLYEGFLNIS